MPPVCLAALLSVGPPAPAGRDIPVPLPIARHRVPAYGLVTEASLAGTTRRVRWEPTEGWVGDWEELAVGRDTGRRTRKWFHQSDYWRVAAVAGSRAAGITHELFVANQWSVELEVETGLGGPRVRVRVNHFPLEGCAVGFGLDSRTGVTAHVANSFDDDDLAAARFWQYVEAVRLLHAWGVVPRVLPPDRK